MKTHNIITSPLREEHSARLSESTLAVYRRIITAAVALTLWVGATNPAQAQINFTINATPTSDAIGYVTSQNYNFVFTLNTASDAGRGPFQPGTASLNDNYTWLQEWNFDSEVWTSVAGDGLAGTWIEPSAIAPDPFSQLIASTSSPSLKLYGGADVSDVGLTAGGTPVKWITFSANYTGLNFSAITGTLPDANAYFAGYTGSYAASSSVQGWIHGVAGDAFFTVNSVTVAAAPEPSTVLSLAFGAVSLLGFRRRRSQAGI